MDQLAELQTYLHQLPLSLASCERQQDDVQCRLHGVSLALRALAQLEQDRLALERAQERIATLSQAVTGEWSVEVRQAAAAAPPPTAAAVSPSPAATQSTIPPSGSGSSISSATTSTPSRMAASQSSILSGSGSSQRHGALRQALRKETAAFALSYARTLDAFDAKWELAAALAGDFDAGPTQAKLSADRRRSRLGRGRSENATSPSTSWLIPTSEGQGKEEDAPATRRRLKAKDVDLFQKMVRFGLEDLIALARSLIRSSVSNREGTGTSQADRLTTDDVVAVFGIVVAARGALAALDLAEQVFVQVVKQSEHLDGREADQLLMTVLDVLHTVDTHQDTGAGPSRTAGELFAPSPRLELELLSFLQESRRHGTMQKEHMVGTLGRNAHVLRATQGTEAHGSLWTRSASNVTAPLSAIGSSAAEAWSASVQTGMSTISGLISVGGSMGSMLIGRGPRAEPEQSTTSQIGTPISAGTPVKATREQRSDGRAPPTLSPSRFVKPTATIAATTAEAHADGTELSVAAPTQDASTAGLSASGATSAFSLTSDTTSREDKASDAPATPAARRIKRDAHSRLEAIVAASNTPSPDISPAKRRSRSSDAPPTPTATASSSAADDTTDPITASASKVLQLLLRSSKTEDGKRGHSPQTFQSSEDAHLPLVCQLCRRLLHHHFPSTSHAEESRKIRLVIIVRWFAFTVLRDLITRPESLGRSLQGGKLIWAARSTQLADGHGTQNGGWPGDRRARNFEDLWMSDEHTCRSLNSLHRLLYSEIVRCAQVSSFPTEDSSVGEAVTQGCRKLLACFGVDDATSQGPDCSSSRQGESTSLRVFSVARKEAAAFVKAVTAAFLEAADRIEADTQTTGSSTAADHTRRGAKFEDVEALLRGVETPHAAGSSEDADRLALLYVAWHASGQKAFVSTSLDSADDFVQSATPPPKSQVQVGRTPDQQDTIRISAGKGGVIAADRNASNSAGRQQGGNGPGSGFSVVSAPADRVKAQEVSGWESPPCSPFAEKTLDNLFQLDAQIAEATRREARPALTSPNTNGSRLTSSSGTHVPGRSSPSIDFAQLPIAEIRSGVLALLRRGYPTRGAQSVISAFQHAVAVAEDQENFMDAAVFRQTAALLQYCSRLEPGLSKGTAERAASHFSDLIAHIAQPFADEHRRCQQRMERARSRVLDLTTTWSHLCKLARRLLGGLQEVRTRCWYACEIRASPDVASSIVTASLALHGHGILPSSQPGKKDAAVSDAADDVGWMESQGIHDLRLPEHKAGFVRDLDPAFQRIARDASVFFSSPLWAREAQLAAPFLSTSRKRGAASKADKFDGRRTIFTSGCGTTALLQGDESMPDTLAGLEAFLQRVQLAATGLLLSEALAQLNEAECSSNASTNAASRDDDESEDPDVWLRLAIDPVVDSLQHRDPDLASQLCSSGADRLLRRFDLHPSPHHKMRALFGLTRLIVTHLSLVVIPPSLAADASTKAEPKASSNRSLDRPSGHLDRRSNVSTLLAAGTNGVGGGGQRTSIWHSRRGISVAEDGSTGTAIGDGQSSGAGRLSIASRPASIGGMSNQGRRPRRALSMYVDDDDEEEDDDHDDGDDDGGGYGTGAVGGGAGAGGMPNIHDLLSLISAPSVGRDHPPSAVGTLDAIASPSSPIAPLHHPSAPSTDQLLNTLESLLIHLLSPLEADEGGKKKGEKKARRLENLYMHLQIVCAFSPTAILDWKEEGKALWDVVLAASSVRREVAMRAVDCVRREGWAGEEGWRRRWVMRFAKREGLELTPDEESLLTRGNREGEEEGEEEKSSG